jgi:hypothetical protein
MLFRVNPCPKSDHTISSRLLHVPDPLFSRKASENVQGEVSLAAFPKRFRFSKSDASHPGFLGLRIWCPMPESHILAMCNQLPRPEASGAVFGNPNHRRCGPSYPQASAITFLTRIRIFRPMAGEWPFYRLSVAGPRGVTGFAIINRMELLHIEVIEGTAPSFLVAIQTAGSAVGPDGSPSGGQARDAGEAGRLTDRIGWHRHDAVHDGEKCGQQPRGARRKRDGRAGNNAVGTTETGRRHGGMGAPASTNKSEFVGSGVRMANMRRHFLRRDDRPPSPAACCSHSSCSPSPLHRPPKSRIHASQSADPNSPPIEHLTAWFFITSGSFMPSVDEMGLIRLSFPASNSPMYAHFAVQLAPLLTTSTFLSSPLGDLGRDSEHQEWPPLFAAIARSEAWGGKFPLGTRWVMRENGSRPFQSWPESPRFRRHELI